MPPFTFPPAAARESPPRKENRKSSSHDQLRDGEWSDTQHSRTPTRRWRGHSTDRRNGRSSSRPSMKRSRTQSLSTLDGRTEHVPRAGEFKILIDHANRGPKHRDQVSQPTLEVPIPHYRLGSPRFSARGTAFLHSSVYTRTSTYEESRWSAFSRPEYERMFPQVPDMEANSSLPRRHSHASPQPFVIRIPPATANDPSGQAVGMSSSPAFNRSKAPIVPSIFDAMASNPDDPAVVRYAPNTKEIVAASPARIIAQITSKNFLDYELLSDFFLTVRAYLPTHDLLAYLLARFEWAINRFDDDGRVIRVRAFAALRHWILNYFPYDFVIDRELRVKFCEQLNALSKTVRERSVHGPSDLKLILDLKKCWNGRCALYWDTPFLDTESRPDLDITPGGIAGSRNSQLTHPDQLWTGATDAAPQRLESVVDPKEAASALHNWFDAVIEAEESRAKTHERQVSIMTSRSLPTSPTSEQSIQAMSCTLPGKGFKKLIGQPDRSPGVHPVPVPLSGRRVCPAAPSALTKDRYVPQHAHKRSGSFSDAFRDKRASLPSMGGPAPEEPVMIAFPYSGSLIRGSVVPPGSPYLDTLVPANSVSDLRSLSSRSDGTDGAEGSKYSSPLSPGVKHILGSIRRALSSKQQSSSMMLSAAATTSKALSTTSHQTELNVEGRRLGMLQQRSRIDLLCAEVAEVYERAIRQLADRRLAEAEQQPVTRGEPITTGDHLQSSTGAPPVDGLRTDVRLRMNSEITNGSRSIIVFDDTQNYPPMPGPPTADEVLAAEERLRGRKDIPSGKTDSAVPSLVSRLSRGGSGVGNATAQEALDPVSPLSALGPDPEQVDLLVREDTNPAAGISRVLSSHRPAPAALSRARSFKSTHSGSKSLRKYASYQIGVARNAPDPNVDNSTISDSFPRSSTEKSDAPPGRMLRRRPGGDLRANQSVHDLEPMPRPRSTGSITTYTESMRGSELYKGINPGTQSSSQAQSIRAFSMAPKSQVPLSLVRTHSSQPALRPSFEAAVAEFARIPDDEGGDIEATLLKLEGRYRRNLPLKPWAGEDGNPVESRTPEPDLHNHQEVNEQSTPLDTAAQSLSVPAIRNHDLSEDQKGDATPTGDRSQSYYNMASSLYAESEESYDSTPLLEREHSNESKTRHMCVSDGRDVSIPRPLFSRNPSQVEIEPNLLSPPIDAVADTESQRRIRYRSSIPTTTDSFLLDEDEFLSDLSSEMSMEMVDHGEAGDNLFGSAAPIPRDATTPLNSGHIAGSSAYPPTPPMTKENASALKSHADRIQEQRKPPTPNPSPVNKFIEPAVGFTTEAPQASTSQLLISPLTKLSTHRHLPFVMIFDSSVIAEQLTIIEKDALNEINWQDLINMRWHHTAPSTLNWVEYLRTQDPTGIELVTARFNIVVKWVLSEIVLTQSAEERASCIVKYIHIAKYCRKAHNYATLLQLTIALTSIDCSRLTKTWDLVPSAEKKALRELETLVTPIKNFHNLRQEMETANADEGCIPVVGEFIEKEKDMSRVKAMLIRHVLSALYIHDLTYNSQKPSQIASTRDGEPLVNFERYRTTATIVKSLLRLIDASAKYTFQPVEGAIERCLWMACLSDDMIRLKSKELE